MSPYNALKLICKILSFKSDNASLKNILQEEFIDWELIVKISSKHLILPTLFCRLQEKELLDLIPNDLKDYLNEITNLNHLRNKKLLEEVHNLSSILIQNDIDHVFLKGTALLASNHYDSLSERMIGDIDILVSPNQLEKAFAIIRNENFTPIKTTLRDKYFEHKHLPRLISQENIGAIEVHKKLLSHKNSEFLRTETILSNRVKTESDVYHLKNSDLLKHVIYNYQIDDKGYYYGNFSLRSLYDAVSILRKNPKANNKENNRYYNHFFTYACILFEDIDNNYCQKNSFQKKWIITKLNNRFLNNLQYKSLRSIQFLKIILSRGNLLIVNSSYRKDVFKNRKRISKLLFPNKLKKRI